MSITYVRQKFNDWLETQKNSDSFFDYIIICRLFNNFSHFHVDATNDGAIVTRLLGKNRSLSVWKNGAYKPKHAILNPADLITSSGYLTLSSGKRTFRQPSFSDYFQSLFLREGNKISSELPENTIFYPVRQWNEEALLDSSRQSIFKTLLPICRNILIEDVDISASLLKRHLAQHDLFPGIWDFSRLLHLSTSYVTLLGKVPNDEFFLAGT